jgi:hypothetical protein
MARYPQVEEAKRRIELEIRDLIINRPDLTYPVIARLFNVTMDTMYGIVKKFGIRRPRGRRHRLGTVQPAKQAA